MTEITHPEIPKQTEGGHGNAPGILALADIFESALKIESARGLPNVLMSFPLCTAAGIADALRVCAQFLNTAPPIVTRLTEQSVEQRFGILSDKYPPEDSAEVLPSIAPREQA